MEEVHFAAASRVSDRLIYVDVPQGSRPQQSSSNTFPIGHVQ